MTAYAVDAEQVSAASAQACATASRAAPTASPASDGAESLIAWLQGESAQRSLATTGAAYPIDGALAADTELANRYTLAHENYLAERERIRLISGTDEVPEIENISAGGMPTRVKCLHAVIGHTLAVGRGINPMGDWGLDEIADWWTPQVCACEPSWRDA